MKCCSCNADIPSSFNFAIQKNECPACGKLIMDEESMALVEELEKFIFNTVKVRSETAHVLALALVVEYSIGIRIDTKLVVPEVKKKSVVKEDIAIVKKVIAQEQSEEESDEDIVKVSDIFDSKVPISSEERDEILKERIETRMIQNAMIPPNVSTRVGGNRMLSDQEMADNPVLEAHRLQRLQKQEEAELSGKSKIRRLL
jgi:hypothetical protein